MSENVLGGQSRERTQSLFDMLINNSKNETENSSYIQAQQQAQQQQAQSQQPPTQSPVDTSGITSSLIENLLTEYLISLPTSLEEFYKIMGEIYVSEILKQCPHIQSPVELMKETLLGRFNNSGDGAANKSFLNSMIRHILQSNLQTAQSNPLESQVMRNMMYRDPQTPQAAQFVKSNSAPDYPMSVNPVISSLIQNSAREESPHKLNIPKAKPVNITQLSTKKRDLKVSKLKAEATSSSKPISGPISMQKPSLIPKTVTSELKTNKILDNESLIEKAKRLLRQRRAVIQKQYDENHKRAKTSDNCEMRVSSSSQVQNPPDELKPSHNKVNSSATSDTIRDIFNEILENIIR
jgi:hypothetical protein